MTKTVALCLLCGGLGAAVALLAVGPPELPRGFAQAPGDDAAGTLTAQRETAQAAGPARQRGAPGPVVDELTPEERINVNVYERGNRSVVNITTKTERVETLFMLTVPAEGSGSGSVLDKQGHVLTNFHVIEGAQQINVTLHDGKTYAAKLVGQDPSTDIAVLRIEAPAESLQPVALGDSSRLRVGQSVFAIGNPFGLERTLTTGVVSSLNRTLPARNQRAIRSIIQVDAAINPGNSGGPLLDSRGRLIGMTTAIASRTGQSAGVGFAIPVGTIARIVPQLIQVGKVIRADIGITKMLEHDTGLVIVAVATNGPAAQAGLQGYRVIRERRQLGPFVEERRRIDRSSADVIVAVDGQPVSTQESFQTLIDGKRPGDSIDVTVVREGGRKETVRVRLTAGES